MAWKLRKDKLEEDAAKGGTDQAVEGQEIGQAEAAPATFSLNDTAVEDLAFVPDTEESDVPSFHPLHLAGETRGHDVVEEPHFPESEASFGEPTFSEESPLEPSFADAPAAFNPFVPFQPDEAPSLSPASFDREEIAHGLISPSDEEGVPRVAPFIVDVPPAAADAGTGGALVVRIGNMSANFTLTKEVTTIGRPDSAAQSYPDVEIELDDAVSRRHAEIRHRDGEYYLVDTMSTNGTLLNGQRVPGDQEQRLIHGDQIRMGDRTEIIFE